MGAKKERNTYIDAVKGIGIISIVIGHASWELSFGNHIIEIGPFVYLYHLAIFLFCSGYLTKDSNINITEFIVKKIKGLYKPFVVYSIGYLLLRNLFINIGLVGGSKYTGLEWIINISNILTFNSPGELLAAFWFIPMMFFAIIIYALIIVFSSKINNVYVKETMRIIFYVLFGGIGIISVESHLGLLCNLQISYLMVPIVALGGYFRRGRGEKFVNVYGLAAALAVLVYVVNSDLGIIELSKFMIINRWLFYPITICGIYFCLALAKYLTKIGIINKFLVACGKYSFDIMALHLFAFKIVDYIACSFNGDMDILSVFPHSYIELWPIYYIAGIGLPLLIKEILHWRGVQRDCGKVEEK